MRTGIDGDTFILRIEGRLTQHLLCSFKDAIEQCRISEGVNDLLVDVSACEYMDSTMLGSLARWAIHIKDVCGKQPFLSGLSGGPLDRLFQRMSLTDLFRVVPYSVSGSEQSELSEVGAGASQSREAYAEGVLLAHETLAELSPENEKEFARLIEMLRRETGNG